MTETYDVRYPFVKEVVDLLGDDGHYQDETWRPGTRAEDVGNYGATGLFADGYGYMHLTVVSRHKPGKYQERVFYTRSWTDPDGKTFGKGALRVCGAVKFNRLRRGYAYEHDNADGEEAKAA